MTTRATIESNILSYLNRSGDTDLTGPASLWFEMGHIAIQRRHNFRCMESVDISITLTDGDYNYSPPTNFKHPRTVYQWNNTTGKIEGFFYPTDFPNIRDLRFSAIDLVDSPLDPTTKYYAQFGGQIEIYPTPSASNALAGKRLGLDCYKFLPLPGSGESNWFTDNAQDFFIYYGLLEALVFLGSQDDDRVSVLRARTEQAFQSVHAMDISQQRPGPLTIRG